MERTSFEKHFQYRREVKYSILVIIINNITFQFLRNLVLGSVKNCI